MFDRFTEKAANALNLAMKSAGNMGHNYIGSEHILLGLLKEKSGVAARCLKPAESAPTNRKYHRAACGAG